MEEQKIEKSNYKQLVIFQSIIIVSLAVALIIALRYIGDRCII